ncbi:MAG: DEAD/DEAH box helicase [Candidatus Helarchaeota archaeon]
MNQFYLSEFPQILESYFANKSLKYIELKEFQRECIKNINENSDILLVAPPGSGKTLPAKYLIFKSLCENQIPVYIVPTVELLKEKWRDLLKFFNNSVYIHVLSGEFKSDISKLRKNEKRAVIIGTYEAFNSFIYRVENFKILSRMRPFGAVVIDEGHYIADRVRGTKLRILIRLLQFKFGCQILIMSASIEYKSAERIAKNLELKLIYEKGQKEYNYEIITYDRGDKKKRVIQAIERFLESFLGLEEGDEYTPKKIIVFGYTIMEIEQLYGVFKKSCVHRQLRDIEGYYMNYIHAGRTFIERETVMKSFRDAGIAVLFSSPVLEMGVDIKEIDEVVIIDADKYEGIRLLQMAGRCRKVGGKIIHVVRKEKVEILRAKMVGVMENNFKGYKLKPIKIKMTEQSISDQILNEMYHKQLTFKEIVRSILEGNKQQRIILPIVSELLNFTMDIAIILKIKKFLDRGLDLGYIKRVGGRYKLSHYGEAVVESIIPLEWGIKVYNIFKTNATPSPSEFREIFQNIYEKAIVQQMNISDDKLKKEIMEFIKKYDVNDPDFWLKHPEIKIQPGYAEIYRRQAVWIAHALYTLYRGFWKDKIENENIKIRKGYFYAESTKKESEKEENLNIYFNRIKRLIKRYSITRYYSVPLMRRKRKRETWSRYKNRLIEYVERAGTNGITSKEIYKQMVEEREKLILEYKKIKNRKNMNKPKKSVEKQTSKKNEKIYIIVKFLRNVLQVLDLFLKPVSLNSIKINLMRLSRAGIIESVERYKNRKGRPENVYYKQEYIERKDIQFRCKDCAFFYKKSKYDTQKLSTYCYIDKEQKQRLHPACRNFKERVKTQVIFRYFEMVQGEIVCPLCKSIGTLGVPRYDEIAICSDPNCKGIIRRVRDGRFIGIKRGYYTPRYVYKRDGQMFQYFPVHKKVLILRKGDQLECQELNPKKNHYIITIKKGDAQIGGAGRKVRKYVSYFSDEIYKVVMVGKKLPRGAREILTKCKIQVEYRDKDIKEDDARKAMEYKLKEAIKELKKDEKGSAIQLAKKHVVAKILSNILYTRKLIGDEYSKSEIYNKQMDILSEIIIKEQTGKLDVNNLRSLEGSAERYIWKAEIEILRIPYKFVGRVSARHAPTYLIYGQKAYDPFNASLNYLYNKLALIGRDALSDAGFNRYRPGQGILHSRINRTDERELLFDFIDQFRPVIRHELVKLFNDGRLRVKKGYRFEVEKTYDFYFKMDEWRRRVYYINSSGRKKLDKLLEDILELKFVYVDLDLKKKEKKLLEIVRLEAKCLANYIMKNAGFGLVHEPDTRKMEKINEYMPFVAAKSISEYEKIFHEFNLINHVFGSGARVKIIRDKKREIDIMKEDPISAQIREIGLAYSIRIPESNIIIIADEDVDGFYSALQVFLEYQGLEDIQITITISNAERIAWTLSKVLDHLIPTAKNKVYIVDIPVSRVENIKVKEMVEEMFDCIDLEMGKLEIIWIDHHEIRNKENINKKGQDLGIKIVHESLPGLTCKDLVYNYIHGLELSKKILVKKELMEKHKIEGEYWAGVYSWRVRNTKEFRYSPKKTTYFFNKVVNNWRDKYTEIQFKKYTEDKLRIRRKFLRQTVDGTKLTIIQIKKPVSRKKLLEYAKEIEIDDQIIKTELLLVDWGNGSYSYYDYTGNKVFFGELRRYIKIEGHERGAKYVPVLSKVAYKNKNVEIYQETLLDDLVKLTESTVYKVEDYIKDFGLEELETLTDGLEAELDESVKLYYIIKEMDELSRNKLKNFVEYLVKKAGLTADSIVEIAIAYGIEILTGIVGDALKELEEIGGDTEDEKRYIKQVTESLFWAVWNKYPSSKFLENEFYKNYKDVEGLSENLLVYLWVFENIRETKGIRGFYLENIDYNIGEEKLIEKYENYFGYGLERGYRALMKHECFDLGKEYEINELERMSREKKREVLRRIIKRTLEVRKKVEQGYKKFSFRDVRNLEKKVKYMSTKIEELDKLMDGGFKIGEIYEIVSNSREIIADLLHYLAVIFQIKKRNKKEITKKGEYILIIDASRMYNGLKMRRVIKMVRRGLKNILDNVIIVPVDSLRKIEGVISELGELSMRFMIKAVLITDFNRLTRKNMEKNLVRKEIMVGEDKYIICNRIMEELKRISKEIGFTIIFMDIVKKEEEMLYPTIGYGIEIPNKIKIKKIRNIDSRREILELDVVEKSRLLSRVIYLEKIGCLYKKLEEEKIKLIEIDLGTKNKKI